MENNKLDKEAFIQQFVLNAVVNNNPFEIKRNIGPVIAVAEEAYEAIQIKCKAK